MEVYPMNYRKFGNTGEQISAIGFGCMRFPEYEKDGKKFVDTDKVDEMIAKAYANGVNYFDTAPFYCNKREYMISALPDGLLIDVHGQCKDAEGKLIPGLFAAGNCSGCFYGTVDYSLFTMGMSVGRAVTFGYLTGKYVGENA